MPNGELLSSVPAGYVTRIIGIGTAHRSCTFATSCAAPLPNTFLNLVWITSQYLVGYAAYKIAPHGITAPALTRHGSAVLTRQQMRGKVCPLRIGQAHCMAFALRSSSCGQAQHIKCRSFPAASYENRRIENEKRFYLWRRLSCSYIIQHIYNSRLKVNWSAQIFNCSAV